MKDEAKHEPFLPSCGFEMMQFYDDWCDKCQCPEELAWTQREEPPGCPLIVQATAMNEQPAPWVVKDGAPCCLDFKEQHP